MHRVGSQIQKIYSFIKDSDIPLNDRHLAQLTNIPLNIVESRCSLLEKEGAIVRAGDMLDHKTGNHSRTWRVKS